MADLPEHLELDLPDWSEKTPVAPLSLAEIIALCEKMLPYWNAERSKHPPPPLRDEPFVLFDDVFKLQKSS